MITRAFFLSLALCLSHAPLSAADWLKAESDHLVVHAKSDEEKLTTLVQFMEGFERLLDNLLPAQTRSGRKLHVFLDKDDDRITRAFGMRLNGGNVSSPEISAAFSQYNTAYEPVFRNSSLLFAQSVHHIDSGYLRTTPIWIMTGLSNFFSATYVSEDGHFILGAPDIRRPMRGNVSASTLSDLIMTDVKPRTDRGWGQFFRYSRVAIDPLMVDPQYSGALDRYLDAYSAGRTMEDAASELGDLAQLADDIRGRMRSRTPNMRRVTLPPQPQATVEIRPMTPDEIALIAIRIERLVDKKRERTARRLSDLTEEFPDSAPVWYEYAAAEFAIARASQLGGDAAFRGFGFSNGELIVTANPYSDAKAWAAVNRSLALDPDQPQAQILRAEIVLSRLVKLEETGDAAAFDDLRETLEPLASDAERHPLAAALSFQSYIEQGLEPSDTALDRLGRAFVANPGVEEFRYAYAVALTRDGQRSVAEPLLSSMLNNPEYRSAAQRALNQ